MSDLSWVDSFSGIEPGDVVVVQAHSQFRGLIAGLVQRMRDAGAVIYLYCGNKEEKKFYQERFADLYEDVIIADHIYGREECHDQPEEILQTARQFEARLGLTYNELILNDRHYGRGFALGGYHHPRSRMSEESKYLDAVVAINRTLGFWFEEFQEKQPKLGLLFGSMLNVVARNLGISVRVPTLLRFENRYYWAHDSQQQSPLIKQYYGRAQPDEDIKFKEAYGAYKSYRAKIKGRIGLRVLFRQIGMITLRTAYWRLRGYEKGKGYYVSEIWKLYWRQRRDSNAMMAADLVKLEDLKGQPFVYFPLASEPESLQSLSPEYISQLTCIASVARDLPAGVVLVVKEHFVAAGRRPEDFYGQIADFKNVRIANIAEDGVALMRHSAAVVIITGTSGLEAAISGKPVISYGRRNIYNFLPHVDVITEETELKPALQKILIDGIDSAQAQFDGERFLKAMVDMSFPLESFSPWKPDEIEQGDVDLSYQALLGTATNVALDKTNLS
jgi:hypothetical protein